MVIFLKAGAWVKIPDGREEVKRYKKYAQANFRKEKE